jgi:hypothetical protein
MAERSPTDPVTPTAHAEIVDKISTMLPPGSLIMLMGGGLMMAAGMRHVVTTKDEDIVLLLVEGGQMKVAEVAAVERLVRALGGEPFVRKDQTSVTCRLSTSAGTFLVEFIRGRRGGHGYFVSRAVLEAVAGLSKREGRVLTPALEALAFLKAWAAVDKAKLVRSGRDGRGYHAARERAFRVDVDEIRGRILENRQLNVALISTLLAVCSAVRAKAVRQVLLETGWNV